MRTKIILFFMILLCFLLQGTVMQSIAVGSISPNLILILCSCMGLLRGRKSGMWVGFFSGLLVDLFYGSVFGFYALIYMYVGFLCGYGNRMFYTDDIKVPLLLVTLSDLSYNLAVYGLQFLLRGRLDLGRYLFRIILPEMVYSVFLTLFVYRIFFQISKRYLKSVRKESESVWILKK